MQSESNERLLQTKAERTCTLSFAMTQREVQPTATTYAKSVGRGGNASAALALPAPAELGPLAAKHVHFERTDAGTPESAFGQPPRRNQ